jgi:hypothetical protein
VKGVLFVSGGNAESFNEGQTETKTLMSLRLKKGRQNASILHA